MDFSSDSTNLEFDSPDQESSRNFDEAIRPSILGSSSSKSLFQELAKILPRPDQEPLISPTKLAVISCKDESCSYFTVNPNLKISVLITRIEPVKTSIGRNYFLYHLPEISKIIIMDALTNLHFHDDNKLPARKLQERYVNLITDQLLENCLN